MARTTDWAGGDQHDLRSITGGTEEETTPPVEAMPPEEAPPAEKARPAEEAEAEAAEETKAAPPALEKKASLMPEGTAARSAGGAAAKAAPSCANLGRRFKIRICTFTKTNY